MKETYTFSRALHLMRYSGKCLGIYKQGVNPVEKFYVENNKFYRSIKTNGLWDYGWDCNGLPSEYIMGSWVEVK